MEMRFSSTVIMLKSIGNPIYLTEGISDKYMYARSKERKSSVRGAERKVSQQ